MPSTDVGEQYDPFDPFDGAEHADALEVPETASDVAPAPNVVEEGPYASFFATMEEVRALLTGTSRGTESKSATEIVAERLAAMLERSVYLQQAATVDALIPTTVDPEAYRLYAAEYAVNCVKSGYVRSGTRLLDALHVAVVAQWLV